MSIKLRQRHTSVNLVKPELNTSIYLKKDIDTFEDVRRHIEHTKPEIDKLNKEFHKFIDTLSNNQDCESIIIDSLNI